MTSLRDVLQEKQALIQQLREEIGNVRNEAARAQQSYTHQLAHAQDLVRVQLQLKEDEVRAKLEIQANLQKEVQIKGMKSGYIIARIRLKNYARS